MKEKKKMNTRLQEGGTNLNERRLETEENRKPGANVSFTKIKIS